MTKPVVSFLAAACSLALVGCVIENDPPRRLTPAPFDAVPAHGDVPQAVTAGDAMLVTIDTDQTMTADPGRGVGVFVEYASGGRWNIWWTCDTAITSQPCDVAISADIDAGEVADVDTAALSGGFVARPSVSRIEARVRTAREVHGISFSGQPGAVVTLEAAVGGLRDGSFLFFVQDGKVNGGYTGKVTNPLRLQGTLP